MQCQVDFRELMAKKLRVIESEQQLLGMIDKPTESVQCSDEVRHCIGKSHQLVQTNGCCYF